MADKLNLLLGRFKKIAEGAQIPIKSGKFKKYAITNFRGGIGKSTLAFNLAWEISRKNKALLLDVCPQRNFSQSLLGEDLSTCKTTIYDAILPHVMAGTSAPMIDDLLVSVPPACISFKEGASVYAIPGSKELFLFPSLLYSTLNNARNLGSRREETSKNILRSLDYTIEEILKTIKATKVLIDTSPFFGGATHLAWVAADALIIPVRVDQHSIEALRLTLSMLRDQQMDFLRLNNDAGIKKIPKIHAIVMTHCGWNRQSAFTPDRSTQSYLAQVIEIADEYADLFACADPLEAIHLLDDFHSAGRISGSKRIPLAKLNIGESHTIQGQRLEVNESLTRYQNEVKALAASL